MTTTTNLLTVWNCPKCHHKISFKVTQTLDCYTVVANETVPISSQEVEQVRPVTKFPTLTSVIKQSELDLQNKVQLPPIRRKSTLQSESEVQLRLQKYKKQEL